MGTQMIESMDELIHKIEIVLYVEAANYTGKLKLHEPIKYTIEEVCDILQKNKSYLIENMQKG